jgi:toxin ParE1/3/4
MKWGALFLDFIIQGIPMHNSDERDKFDFEVRSGAKKRFTVSTQARQDLKDIKDYIASDSLDRAEAFVRSIADRFQKLASFPGMGKSYDALFPNLRGFPVGNYIIFYRPTEQGISIERIRSGYCNIDALFQQDGDS